MICLDLDVWYASNVQLQQHEGPCTTIRTLRTFYVAIAIWTVLADCKNKNTDGHPLPSNAPHHPDPNADTTTGTQQESIAEPLSMDLDNATIDSQFVASEGAETHCQDIHVIKLEETAEPPLILEKLIKDLQEEIQRFVAGEYNKE